MRTKTIHSAFVAALLLPVFIAAGQETAPTGAKGQDNPAASEERSSSEAPPPEPTPKVEEKKSFFVAPKGFGARNETEPPGYVKPLSKYEWMHAKEIDWLDFGIEQRTRWEYRDDNYRQTDLTKDTEFLLRTRVYLGIREVIDPFRFVIEFQDSRQEGSDFPETNRDVNEADLLQAYAELYFRDALGEGRPLRFQFGRMAFDSIDRKLIARNRWRNTTNNFEGFRLQLGQRDNAWQLDFLAVQPVERRLRQFDRADEERWFYGVIGAWRRWSRHVTLEPYYLVLDEDRKSDVADREIHTIGLHAYGPIGSTRFDYDVDGAFQFGDDGDRDHRAFAAYGQLGYSFKHDWRPRLSASLLYASGDRNPDDGKSERFDRLFGAAHFLSASDYFTYRNNINPKIRLELRPTEKLRFDTSYGAYWLASESDTWPDIGRRDRTGRSGDFIGQEVELRARYKMTVWAELEIGYSHFLPGAFVENTGDADDSDFFYVQTTVALP